jgi:hypothetical protein
LFYLGRREGEYVWGVKKKIEHNHVEVRVWKVGTVMTRDGTLSKKKT